MRTDTKPQATERKRERYKTLLLPNKDGTKPVKMRVHTQTDIVRTAFCFKHRVHSTNFVGVNEHGWVFGCSGPPHKEDSVDPKGSTPPSEGHYFIACPA